MDLDTPLSILLVDDNDATRRALEHSLRAWGHEVFSMAGALEALDVLRQRPEIRLLVTDWVMPDMDGIELTRAARRLERDRYLHVVVLTGNLVDVEKLRKLGRFFCRNVFIYFHDAAIRRSALLFHEQLRDPGHLFVGSAGSSRRCWAGTRRSRWWARPSMAAMSWNGSSSCSPTWPPST